MEAKVATCSDSGNESHDTRALELDDLLSSIRPLILPFVASADSAESLANGGSGSTSTLVDSHTPQELIQLLSFQLPDVGSGKDGLVSLVERILRYSVNTWDRGYMHKLTGSTNAVGVISELILGILNTNLHVYSVSPVLTIIEKTTARSLARLFNLGGPHAGGFTVPGGSAANTTAMVVARNVLFPETRDCGNGSRRFVVFASDHGHYSMEKAAQTCGIGGSNVWVVPVDAQGRMIASELEKSIVKARAEGFTPFFVTANAGTTVVGSFDPFLEIGKICRREKLWYHIDAVYGGAVVFSAKYRHKMLGSDLADSIVLNPHKMMGVPATCTFLLGSDLRIFWKANTLPAGYLFHGMPGEEEGHQQVANRIKDGIAAVEETDCWDLADLTLQCGRRGDALKLALGWNYYGTQGYGAKIDHAFEVTAYFSSLVEKHKDLELLGENPPPCLQVCFYYAPGGRSEKSKEENTRITQLISNRLVQRGFMVDFAPGDRGTYFRAAVHIETTFVTVDVLVTTLVEIGKSSI